jgi:4'-phosphopantetheinyl transferase EntD
MSEQQASKPDQHTATALLSPLVSALFPPVVAAAQLTGDAKPALLDPVEREFTRDFAPKRLREFAAGRLCARRALAELGIRGHSLRQGRDRRPVWPEGVVGSITHTDEFCGAVVASMRRLLALGLDAETIGRVTPEIWPQICTPSEANWIRSLREPACGRAAALIFSAKEACYKCCSAISVEWIDFQDLELELQGQLAPAGSFAIRPKRALDLPMPATASLAGRYRFEGELILTGMAFPVAEFGSQG